MILSPERLKTALSIAGLLIAAASLPATAIDKTFGYVGCSNPKQYSVRLQTDVIIPPDVACQQVRTWHAIPAYKPWTNTPSPYGARDIRFSPEAKIEIEDDKRSAHVYFENNQNFPPGAKLSFVTSYLTDSSQRRFNPSAYSCSWSDCQKYNLQNALQTKATDPTVSELAFKIKQNHSPAVTVMEFCHWIGTNIKYDNSVSYRTDDVTATLKNRRGHCGHAMGLLTAFCHCVGIHTRNIVGLNLKEPLGKPSRLPIPDDLGNLHLWGEVYLPKIGWVEVEPIAGEKCFEIPASYIQSNTAFQNAAVWIKEAGKPTEQARWEFTDGRYQCKYKVLTRITYTEAH